MDLNELKRLEKQGWRKAEESMVATDERDKLKGVTKRQNMKTRNIRDIVNIGSGTRCRFCGMLHFCYLERCGACKKPMDYNLAKTEEVV